MKELRIEGYPCGTFKVPEPEGSPYEIAQELMAESLAGLYELPDTSRVVLSEITFEEYIPPRCRKPRRRMVTTPIMRWTLGEFRRVQSGSRSSAVV